MKKLSKLVPVLCCSAVLWGCVATPQAPLPNIAAGQDSVREVAMRAYTEGDYHLAEGLLQQLAAAPYLDPQAPCFLGAIHYRQHAYEAALKRFEECSLNYPDRAEVWFNAAASHLRLATELMLTGPSYQEPKGDSSRLATQYESLLQSLLKLQRVHTNEVY